MASTYSPSLRLELIGDGDQSGIWGQTTNNNLGALIEQAIVGVVSISMLDATYTLSNYNGVEDESRNQVLVLTGALTATRNVIAPLVEKTYVIKNNTTGSQSIQIIGSSGLGVTIPNGATTLVYCDGTNFYNANTGTAGNYTVNGNLSVTGTTSLTGALSASTGTFSGAISSVSPTFTGTPISPTATAGTNTTQIATTAFVQAATTALGLGTMSTQNANAVAITGGTVSGLSSLGVSGTATATTFSGAGTSLTGTAASLSIGGTAAGLSSTLAVTSGGTGVTTSTGSGSVVLSTSPTLVTPVLGTPSSGNLANCTFPTLNQNTTGTAGGLTGTPNITVGTVNASTIGGTTITASTQFSCPGTGLTGTAASLSIGGNAATATSATSATNASGLTGTPNITVGTVNGTTITASTQFSGPGTGLTGTAASLSVGGSAASLSATLAVASGGTGVTSSTGTGSVVLSTNPTISGAVVSAMASSVITSGTAVATTSGTTVGFTSIPSWVKRISFIFNGVGASGSSVIMIQIGSGSYTTSGYTAMGGSNATTTYNSTGFTTSYDSFSTNRKYGIATLDLISSNTWVFAFQGASINTSNATTLHTGAGSLGLSGALDRIQVTTVNGTDTFTAGTVNIFYE